MTTEVVGVALSSQQPSKERLSNWVLYVQRQKTQEPSSEHRGSTLCLVSTGWTMTNCPYWPHTIDNCIGTKLSASKNLDNSVRSHLFGEWGLPWLHYFFFFNCTGPLSTLHFLSPPSSCLFPALTFHLGFTYQWPTLTLIAYFCLLPLSPCSSLPTNA